MQEYVAQRRPVLRADRLRVSSAVSRPPMVFAVEEQVAAAGEEVSTTFENTVWAVVPLTGSEVLAGADAVWTPAMDEAVVQPGKR